jgi:hypothetical protein
MISIRFSKHNLGYVKHNISKGTKLRNINNFECNAISWAETHCVASAFSSKLWFGMQKGYKNELLTLQRRRFHMEKNFVFLHTCLKYYTLSFLKWYEHVISIHFSKHNFDYVKHSVLNGTKLIDNVFQYNAFSWAEKHCIYLSFTTKLWTRMQKAYKIELLTLQHTRLHKKKNFVFLSNLPLKYNTCSPIHVHAWNLELNCVCHPLLSLPHVSIKHASLVCNIITHQIKKCFNIMSI